MIHGNLALQKATMAMSVKGRNRRYHWFRIQSRHFSSTAADIADQTSRAISKVEDLLPVGFPSQISEPILEGVRKQSEKLV